MSTTLREASTQYVLACGHDECDCNNAFEAGAKWAIEEAARIPDKAAEAARACSVWNLGEQASNIATRIRELAESD